MGQYWAILWIFSCDVVKQMQSICVAKSGSSLSAEIVLVLQQYRRSQVTALELFPTQVHLFYVRMSDSVVTTSETLSHSLLPLFKEFILTIQSYFGYVPDRRLQYFAVTIVKYLMEIYRDKQRLGANYL